MKGELEINIVVSAKGKYFECDYDATIMLENDDMVKEYISNIINTRLLNDTVKDIKGILRTKYL